MATPPDACARELLEVVPLVMRTIRAEMRRQRAPGLTVPQFRLLVYLERRQGASLSEAAAYLGLTAPSTSVMVEALRKRGLVDRRTNASDRRRVTLALTPDGQAAMETAREVTRARLAERLAALTEQERAVVSQAMNTLRPLFTGERQA